MTSRQTGRRIQAMSAGRRRPVGGAGKRSVRPNEPLNPRELRRLAQVVACGAAFVLLVAAKLLLPGRMEEFNSWLAAAMGQNMDVQAVFSAVGRAFAGEGGGTVSEVYQAVFHPQEAAEAAKTASQRTLKLREGAALEGLRAYRPQEEQGSAEEAPPAEALEDTASTLAYILYSEENLPESVSMEQAILGFDYCTPVSGVLSSDFGYREHPVEGEERFHNGEDLAAGTVTEVDCFADGHVTAVGESSSYGRYCIVAHEGGYSTLYAHCSRVVVSSGTEVTRGQKIAEVGETGMATGPHLHFELQRDGVYLNPIYYVAAA